MRTGGMGRFFPALCMVLIAGFACSEETPPRSATKAADSALPAKLDIAEPDVQALATKLASAGAEGVPSILKSLNGNPSAEDAVQVLAGIRALVILGAKDAVPDLIEFVKTSANPEVSEEAWKALGRLANPKSLPSMLFILESPREMPYRTLVAQIAAMHTLVAISQQEEGPDQFVKEIDKLYEKASAIAKMRIVEVLEKLDTSRSRNMLSALLSDNDRDVQQVTLRAIARADDSDINRRIQLLLSSPDPMVQREAAAALGRCKAVAAVPALIKLIDSRNKGVRSNAIGALRNITGRNFASTAAATAWLDEENADGKERFNALVSQLKSESPRMAPLFVEQMSKLPLMQDKEVSALLPYVNHVDFRIRAAVAEALGQTPPSLKTCSLLIVRMGDSSDVVVASAWRSLKQLSGQKFPKDREAWAQWAQKRN